jgi:ABC-2 type transport system ATP-binding protein
MSHSTTTFPSSSSAVIAEGIEKRFGDTHALRGVDLRVEPGTILGLLGPNGAGKTTMVRILATLSKPDAGHAQVAGFDVVRQPTEVRRRIGLTGQFAALDEVLTGRENLEMIGSLYHLPPRVVKERGDELLEQFDLGEAANRPSKEYSGGMRRRLDLAASLIARPPVLFLDEPTTGLDPRGRLGMWDIIAGLVREGTTLVLTTQYLEEADRLANHIAVIDKGLVIARGTAAELKATVGGERIEITVAADSDLAGAVRVLVGFGDGTPAIDDQARHISVGVRAEPGLINQVVGALDGQGIQLDDVVLRRPTLDDVFLSLTGQSVEAAGTSTDDTALPRVEGAQKEAA